MVALPAPEAAAMSIARVAPTNTLHAIPVHHHLWQASSLFHSLGNSYEERQTNDEGGHLQSMVKSLDILYILVPSLDRPPPFERQQPALQEAGGGVLHGAVLPALAVARAAVSKHWINTMAAASEVMQTRLKKLMSAMTPSWRTYLTPSATGQLLINSCGSTLGNTDCKAVMAMITETEQARSRD